MPARHCRLECTAARIANGEARWQTRREGHVLKQSTPHPLPASVGRDALQVAQYSFGMYGNICSFGTYDDSVQIRVLRSEPATPVQA